VYVYGLPNDLFVTTDDTGTSPWPTQIPQQAVNPATQPTTPGAQTIPNGKVWTPYVEAASLV
jgi:hypothetical protein